MGQVLIRNVPDDVIESYKAKARLAGTSLEKYLRELLDANKPFTAEERVAFSQKIRNQGAKISKPLTKAQIRQGLD